METLTTYEAIDLMATLSDQLDSIFGYWISASFAVVIGTFVAKDHLNLGLAFCIGALYLLASVMFASRWLAVMVLVQELITTGLIPSSYLEFTTFLPTLRLFTFASGLLITEGYLMYAYRRFRHESMSSRELA